MTSERAEGILAAIWQRTFALVASDYEAWMERAFVRRGRGVVDVVYPDPAERSRLYSYGYTPHIGRRFAGVADTLTRLLQDADTFGDLPAADRLTIFVRLGRAVASDKGFGFLVRDTITSRTLYDAWDTVLAWWMRGPAAPSPQPDSLRDWQIFVADNFEYRLGVAIGAVVSRRWTENSADPLNSPTLESWKGITQMPWFAFWAKELLRWGTLEPLVAFALTQGMAQSRENAEALRPEFLAWLRSQPGQENATGEDLIDPTQFLAWSRSRESVAEGPRPAQTVSVALTGTGGRRGRYAVVPVPDGGLVRWLDAAGYELATSDNARDFVDGLPYRHDYELQVAEGHAPAVRRTF